MSKHKKSLFIHRRDLRLQDNTGLMEALNNSDTVICCFIMTPTQLTNKNDYKSNNAIQFMFESLDELDQDLRNKSSKLFYFYGEPHKVINKLINQHKIDAVYINADYTPYSIKRDNKIKSICQKKKISFHIFHDDLLHKIASILTNNNTIYEKFTPYFRKARKEKVTKPKRNNYLNYYTKSFKDDSNKKSKFINKNENINIHGGRNNALKILNNLNKFKNYNKKRNYLTYETTNLSAYIKFGCVSIREVYDKMQEKLNKNNDLFKQLYWRDFYYNIALNFPHVFGEAMKKQYNKIKWENNRTLFSKWKEGQTGYPIVDAGIREMNITGFMHNRTRLITSNFLIKLLLIDWRWGEKYFATQLVDYDPSVNNGNWQWSASSGADSQPYFRIFNPWTQGEDYDKECEYIKHWIPELKNIPNDHIHKWYKYHQKYNINYPKPCVDYEKQRREGKKMYKKALPN